MAGWEYKTYLSCRGKKSISGPTIEVGRVAVNPTKQRILEVPWSVSQPGFPGVSIRAFAPVQIKESSLYFTPGHAAILDIDRGVRDG